MKEYRLTDWLPTTKKEVELRGWDELDVILFSGDAYVDHPSFGAAVIGRILEAEGLRVAIIPQPNWRDDLRDFKKLGRPRLFFGISPGCMDSMVNKYTANKRLRSDDAYTPDARPDMRPEYPSIVYTQILKKLFPDVPVVLGGIEASMRRLTHYDYWQDRVRPSILLDSGADSLIYGMGEKPVVELAERLKRQQTQMDAPSFKKLIADIPQMVYLDKEVVVQEGDITLFSHEECLKDKKKEAANFRHIEEESNKYTASRILQKSGKLTVVVNPPYPPLTEAELDRSFDLPYTRLPHPKYKGKRIPAYDMIKFSVNLHRGCFGGCAFCTISAHQGKFIVSRSKESILKEVKAITELPDFKGYLSDLGGPSANMYRMKGRDEAVCRKCKRPSCIYPKVCPNLNTDHRPLLDIYHAVDALPGIKKSFIGSGVRYDLLLHQSKDPNTNTSARLYPYSHDRCHRSMVHGLPSLYAGTGIQCQNAARETGSTPILLLVQTRRAQEHHKRTAPDRTDGFDRQAIRETIKIRYFQETHSNCMKRFLLLCLSLLPIGATGLLAQSECLPQNYSIIFGGGVSLPHVEGNRNDFFSKNGNRVGYDLMTEGRYYITPLFAAGLQYDYLRMARLPDKAHLHCIRPNITYRPLWSNGNQGLFLSFGIGYMNYQERTYKRGERNGHLFHKGYCGITFAAGYEFRISRKLSGMIRCDFLTADWFANPDARLYNTDGYDDGVDHSWFKNNITFFNLGFALQFGR